MLKKGRGVVSFLLAGALLINSALTVGAEKGTQPSVQALQKQVYGQYGIAIDAADGKVLFSKNGTKAFYPASMTKVMTAILCVERLPSKAVLQASKGATTREQGSKQVALRPGEKLTREEALEALMVTSSNDVAAMIGETISGTEAKFGNLMTARAKQLGAKQTTFKNASGLPNTKHKTTAYDMALIMKEALKYPEITKYMKTNKAVVKTDKRTITIVTKGQVYKHKEMLYGKTGYTNASGNTLVSAIKKGKKTIISVVMKSKNPNHYSDVLKMATYGYNQLMGIPNAVPVSKKYKITSSAANIRSSPSLKGKKVGVLKKGATVAVVGTSGKWYKISYKKKIAYVSKSLVKYM